jgi:hypothetical protein
MESHEPVGESPEKRAGLRSCTVKLEKVRIKSSFAYEEWSFFLVKKNFFIKGSFSRKSR